MLRERYERMRQRFGEDSPGTQMIKRQLDELEKSLKGQQAMKDDRKLVMQMVPKAPATKSSSNAAASADTPPSTRSEPKSID